MRGAELGLAQLGAMSICRLWLVLGFDIEFDEAPTNVNYGMELPSTPCYALCFVISPGFSGVQDSPYSPGQGMD